jgi:DNA-binding NarL/FixJ family response regulator
MIRVLIADDFSMMRKVMARMLDEAEDIVLGAEVPRLDSALEHLEDHSYDVIIMNDYIPPMTTDLAIRLLRERHDSTPVLVVSIQADGDTARRALREGANGFIFKAEFGDHFLPAVRALAAGNRYLSPIAMELLAPEEPAEPGG